MTDALALRRAQHEAHEAAMEALRVRAQVAEEDLRAVRADRQRLLEDYEHLDEMYRRAEREADEARKRYTAEAARLGHDRLIDENSRLRNEVARLGGNLSRGGDASQPTPPPATADAQEGAGREQVTVPAPSLDHEPPWGPV